VRIEEVRSSLSALAELTTRAGDLDAVASRQGIATNGAGSGVGICEGWRGVVVHRVELDGAKRLRRVKVVDPSFLNWPALSVALTDTIVPDFPLANQSFNLSYAGNDL
jgi:Ni,Fe-hydrogenase III large subunit